MKDKGDMIKKKFGSKIPKNSSSFARNYFDIDFYDCTAGAGFAENPSTGHLFKDSCSVAMLTSHSYTVIGQ